MEDENGVVTVENEETESYDSEILKLKQKIEGLEVEKEKLVDEIELLRSKETEGEQAKKTLEAVAKRAAELEIEVVKLQHDFISAMNESEEAGKEVDALKKERVESEKNMRELERKIGVLEMKEVEEKSKGVRIEEEMREKIDEKEKEITEFKNKNVELSKKSELAVTRSLELEAKVLELEAKINVVCEKVVEGGTVVGDGVNGIERGLVGDGVNGIERGLVGDKFSEKKIDWQMIAIGSGVIAAALAVGCVFAAKRSSS